MNVDRLVEQARERALNAACRVARPELPESDVGPGSLGYVTRAPIEAALDVMAAGLADAVERLRDDNRRLRTEAVGLTEDGRTVPELESEVERLQRDNDLALRAMGEYWEERDAARARVAALEAERQAVIDAVNLYGDETLHHALDAIGFAPRVPSTGQET